MERGNQEIFVKDLCESVKNKILKEIQSDKIPDSWDGIELRAYLASAFEYEAETPAMTRSRKKDFNNYRYTNGLTY